MLNRRHGNESPMGVYKDEDGSPDKEAAMSDEEKDLDDKYRYKNTVSADFEGAFFKKRRQNRKSRSDASVLRAGQWMVIGFTLFFCISMFFIGIRFQAKRHSYAFPWNEGRQTEINVDWPEYMKKLDPLWKWARQSDAPSTYGNSPFMGNGNLGLTVRVDNDGSNKIRLDVGRSDIYFGTQRFPVGCLWVDLSGAQVETKYGTMRTHLWDAITDGSIGYSEPVSFSSFVHAIKDVIVVSLKVPSSFNHEKYITFNPGYNGNPNPPQVRPAKPPVCTKRENTNICTQEVDDETKSFSVAWSVVTERSSLTPQLKNVLIYLTVSPIAQLSESKALATLANVRSVSYDNLLKSHKDWWNSYYPSSFITMDNITMESFYWIQMYKLASATRGDKNIIDMHGPWLKDDAPNGSSVDWATGLHLSYSAVYPSNRLSLGSSLLNYLKRYIPVFVENIPVSYRKVGLAAPSGLSGIDARAVCTPKPKAGNKYDPDDDEDDEENEQARRKRIFGADNGCRVKPPAPTGNILLACYNLWLQYSYSQDKAIEPTLVTLLERAIEYYSKLARTSTRGYLQFPATYTPGHQEKKGENSNYDIALYKWALRAYAQLKRDPNVQSGKISLSDALLKEARVPPFTVAKSSSEYAIAEGIQFTKPSSSFSHLYMVYPLSDLTNLSDKNDVKLAERSVVRWVMNLKDSPDYLASSRPVLSMMASFLGNKIGAYRNITRFIGRALSPNTFYIDSVGDTRIDLTLAASNALHSMFLQSGDTGEIRIFPGVDTIFIRKVAFWHLRAHKGILVSSRMGLNNEPDFVELVNPTNSSVNVTVVHGFSKGFKIYPNGLYDKNISPKATALRIPAGKSVLMVSKKRTGDVTISPIPSRYWDHNPWGIHK